ncbi:unnamed protein product [Caenorhabditis angaria]|uniref:Uncharacterized protein n=1 Tax=Caenorhabditis angaria TaxID=860376 RepID=A0A9P1N6G3_9PELO|nr:unnamed protein product [Caenorhabditis angaria]
MNWERAIIIGDTRETFFVASSHDEMIMRKNDSNRFLSMGDCLEVTSNSSKCWNMIGGKPVERRIIDKFEKVDQFVQWRPHKQNRGIIIMATIIDCEIVNHPSSNQPVRCFRTSFLEKIYDCESSRTSVFSQNEMIGMNILTCHVSNREKFGFWTTINVNVNGIAVVKEKLIKKWLRCFEVVEML